MASVASTLVVWNPALSPAKPAHRAELVTVDDALLSRFHRGPLHTLAAPAAPRSWMTGAAYTADGELVEASRRWWSGDRSAPVSVDPEHVGMPPAAPRLEGSWRYAGHWTTHFGHFLIEVLTNLWGPVSEVDGLVFHRTYRGGAPGRRRDGVRSAELLPWQRDLLALAGYVGPEARVVRHRPLRVDHLVVASRPVLLKSWAAEEAVEVWRRVSDAVGDRGPDERVFLSRTLFNQDGTSSRRDAADVAWDTRLDELFARAGFAVVHPERLSVAEQVATIRGAAVLAGSAGSALHLSAVASPGTRVLEIGDTRSPSEPMPTQRLIDAACGHLTAFVGYRDDKALGRVLRSL